MDGWMWGRGVGGGMDWGTRNGEEDGDGDGREDEDGDEDEDENKTNAGKIDLPCPPNKFCGINTSGCLILCVTLGCCAN